MLETSILIWGVFESMRIHAVVTDFDWFDFLRGFSELEEVNRRQLSENDAFKTIGKKDIFLFKFRSGLRTGGSVNSSAGEEHKWNAI